MNHLVVMDRRLKSLNKTICLVRLGVVKRPLCVIIRVKRII